MILSVAPGPADSSGFLGTERSPCHRRERCLSLMKYLFKNDIQHMFGHQRQTNKSSQLNVKSINKGSGESDSTNDALILRPYSETSHTMFFNHQPRTLCNEAWKCPWLKGPSQFPGRSTRWLLATCAAEGDAP
ncbi:hypothetical protein EYF80_015540 [Liparis tanakae]|uniref:Uncharacterized protein n=1 Tax=Liparis tanakae TaxID=230148 RepID=A0A4Z2I8H8_9TELE|nr:hypothetical protein EYF80_015540 [Liparis tanakae]